MASLSDIYCTKVYSQLRPIHAVWPPATVLKLGDYGRRVGARFERLGSLSDLGIAVPPWRGVPGSKHIAFSEGVDVAIAVNASVADVGATATLDVGFGSEYSIFFNAAGCSTQSIASKNELGQSLLANFSFQRDWVVVTDIVRVDNFTVAVSQEKGATLSLQGDGAAKLDLKDANAKLYFKSQSKVGYFEVSENRLTPLIGLCGIRTRWIGAASLQLFSDGWDETLNSAASEAELFTQV